MSRRENYGYYHWKVVSQIYELHAKDNSSKEIPWANYPIYDNDEPRWLVAKLRSTQGGQKSRL